MNREMTLEFPEREREREISEKSKPLSNLVKS